MFDLDLIEKDWKENSFCLSDEEVLEIFKGEGITTVDYDREINKFYDSLPKISAEERLLALIFNDETEKKRIDNIDFEAKKMYETQYPKRKKLSYSSQMKVVEGCLDVVFNGTRYWYSYFNEKISMEKLYYICLDALFNSAKYCLHYSNKLCFRAYANKCIERSIIKNVARWEHISYRNAYYIINHLERIEGYFNSDYVSELKFDYEKEIPFKSSFIYEKIKNDSYDVDYISKILSDEFMLDYKQALNELTYEERKVMELLFDSNGYYDLSIKQISEFLVTEPDIIKKIKREAIKKLKKDDRFNKYK